MKWAAINNHYAMCEFLLDAGADIDAVGGESVATPAMWAAQKCHFYIVHLLLERGANPLLTDGQGYNLLHLATFDGNVFLILVILHQNIPVDSVDPVGHSSLMWAVYKGYPAVVDLLLQWGASVTLKDQAGLSPLHWALVRGNPGCVQKIMEAGADRFAKTNEGKTPATVAAEMNTVPQWLRALKQLGYNMDGTIRPVPLPFLSFIQSKLFLDRYFLFAPFVLIYITFMILSRMPVFVSIPISLVLVYMVQWTGYQMLQWAPGNMKQLDRTVGIMIQLQSSDLICL